MNTFTGRLDQLEAKLQRFIEGKLSRLSSIRASYQGLSRQLVSAMRSGTVTTGEGILLAPDQYTLLTHPTQVAYLSDDPDLLVGLAEQIHKVGRSAGLYFGQDPVVNVSPNEDVTLDKIEIIARISDKVLGQTAVLDSTAAETLEAIPQNAFLIVNGRDLFPLEQIVVNIGRSEINDLIIEDPRVSRQHAQIRAIHGRYGIFDLDSTGGTFINKKRITQSVLRPGDVVSLAGVYLIYGQERSSSLENTKELISDAF
jgi:pSer/pThr/pTyr-binding forkhead associated (FHA) protein